jgi:hypothetical protein
VELEDEVGRKRRIRCGSGPAKGRREQFQAVVEDSGRLVWLKCGEQTSSSTPSDGIDGTKGERLLTDNQRDESWFLFDYPVIWSERRRVMSFLNASKRKLTRESA